MTGCSCKEEPVKVKLDYREMPTVSESSKYLYDEYGLLSYELDGTGEYDQMLTDKKNFFLFVYRKYCGGCGLVSPILKEYIDENQLVVYTLDLGDIPSKHDLFDVVDDKTPHFILVGNGAVVYYESPKLVGESATDKEAVNKWISEHIEWGNN